MTVKYQIRTLGIIALALFYTLGAKAFSPLVKNVLNDYQRYYSIYALPRPLTGIAIAGVMANAEFDFIMEDIWHGSEPNDNTTLFRVFEKVGDVAQYPIAFPMFAGILVLESMANYRMGETALGTWANHSLRTLMLGAPQQAGLTWMLGGGRPETQKPQWHLFRYHRAVSGHAFYGAVPFLNLAQQLDSWGAKTLLTLASVMPGLARVNSNKHYFSQAFLGWWLAWCATQTVWEPDKVSRKPYYITLQPPPQGQGFFIGIGAKI